MRFKRRRSLRHEAKRLTHIRGGDHEKSITAIEEMVRMIARLLVDYPDEIVVHRAEGDGFYHLEIVCDERDAGTLIGQRGKHAKAIRFLAMRAATVGGIRVTLNILSRDQYALAPR